MFGDAKGKREFSASLLSGFLQDTRSGGTEIHNCSTLLNELDTTGDAELLDALLLRFMEDLIVRSGA